MASLFEQYEKAAQQSADLITASRVPHTERSASHIVQLAVQNNGPIFNKRRINFSVPSPLTCLAASNGQLAFAMANKTILRLDLKAPDQRDEIDLSKSISIEHVAQTKIQRLFLDITGNHLLVSLVTFKDDVETPVDMIYLNRKTKKPRSANKMKGHIVNAVAWDYHTATETNTGPILVGTNTGIIFETVLKSPQEDRSLTSTNIELYWKQIFDLGKDGPTSVTGIEYHVLPGNENKCFILLTTLTRLYQFFGAVPSFGDHPVMINVFNNYPDLPARFHEIPSTLPYSQLHFFYPKAWELPKAFAWMTGVGVIYNRMDYSGQAGPDTIVSETKLVSYPKDDNMERHPLAIALTEFHVLILYRDRVKGVCILNEQPVMEDIFTETYGSLVQLVKDPVTGTIWICSEYALYKYAVNREARHVWQVYMMRGEYEMAKQYCRDDPFSLDVVLTKQAEDLFIRNCYNESALHYAGTQVSFEVVALKFLQTEQKSALQSFLKKKLESLPVQDKTQRTMIVTWLVELYLNRLGELRDAQQQGNVSEELRQEFYNFLAIPIVIERVKSNSNIIYELIASHGDRDALVKFALLIYDYERVIRIHLQNAEYRQALKMFQTQKLVDLFYQFCPLLMQFIPTETTDVCIALGRKLDPTKLIPALVHYNDNSMKLTQKNEAIRYLEFCVRKLDEKERTIHNYLLSLYAKHLPERLEPYFTSQGQDPVSVNYDLEYALRVCSEFGHHSACVHIYAVMGLFEEAVDLSLKFDVDKAKQYADRPEENEELRKKLWLKIAHHVVREENDIRRAMEFLQQCELIKIEDILPFFPNFVTIDHFKDAIIQSLHEYNQHIEGLKEEMEEATQSTQQIRSEIRAFNKKSAIIQSQDKCAACPYPVLACSLYLFPCRHLFHIDCLVSEIMLNLSSAKKQRVEEIKKTLASFDGREEPLITTTNTSSNLGYIDQIKAELDSILATECPYCGESMIRNVDAPFISPSNYDEVMHSWE